MFLAKKLASLALLIAPLLLTACGKNDSNRASISSAPGAAANDATPAPSLSQAAADPGADLISKELSLDTHEMILLVSWGPSTEQETNAVDSAKEKMAQVKAAKAVSERDQKIAADAKTVYAAKIALYQQALSDANNAKQGRVKSMQALTASQKELDDAWAAVGAARDAYNKAIIDPKSSAEQKDAAEATLKKAYVRADQAAELMGHRTLELQSSQTVNQSVLGTVTTAAEATTQAGSEYADKAAIAARSADAVTAALAEEKKAMAFIYSLNRARAKAVAESLANAAYAIITTHTAAENARDAAKAAAQANQGAADRSVSASKEDASAKQAVISTADAANQAAASAQAKAEAKTFADGAAAEALKPYAEAKAVYDAAAAVSNKSAADAKLAAKAVADATWRATVAAKAVDAANNALKVKDSPEAQKALADAQAAVATANQALEDAKAKLDAANTQAAADAAITTQAKADAEAKLVPYRQATAVAAAAAKDKATADGNLIAANKAAANAKAVAASKAAAAEKAVAVAEAATNANNAAAEKFRAATQTEADARANYNKLYSQNEAYKLSATRTEEEEKTDEQKLYSAALWASEPEGNYWTSLVVAAIRQFQPSLERARDINDWCPGYFGATDHQREVCWLRIIGGLVKFESSFHPEDKFQEPNGSWSVGLMALTSSECGNYNSVGLLQKPLLNLSCGVGKFARLVERDGLIYSSDETKGASAYWSTLRAPYQRKRPDGKGYYQLGKRNLILPLTTTYKNY